MRFTTNGLAVLTAGMLLAAAPAGVFAQQADSAAHHAHPAPAAAADSLTAMLTGSEEVPQAGDPYGRGDAAFRLDAETGEVCFRITVSNLETPTAAHIHRGAARKAGPPVVDLDIGENGLRGCVAEVEQALIEEISASPAEFYLNVHNKSYPAGALRGQLGAQEKK